MRLFQATLLFALLYGASACNPALPGQEPLTLTEALPLSLTAEVSGLDTSPLPIIYEPILTNPIAGEDAGISNGLFAFGYHGSRNGRNQLTLLLSQPGASIYEYDAYALSLRFFDRNFGNNFPETVPTDALLDYFTPGREFSAADANPAFDFGLLIPKKNGSIQTYRSRTSFLPVAQRDSGTLRVESVEFFTYTLPDQNGNIPAPQPIVTFSFDLPVGLYEGEGGPDEYVYMDEGLRDYVAERSVRVRGTATLLLSSSFQAG